MKTFLQYLTEADPYRDQHYRQIAQTQWDKLYAAVRSKRADRMLETFDEKGVVYGQYLYKLTNEKKIPENDIMIIFSPARAHEHAAFSVKKLTSGISVPVMFLGLNKFNDVKMFTAIFLAERKTIHAAFIHEFIHFLDSLRIGDNFPTVLKAAAKGGKTAQTQKNREGLELYFNNPLEFNAWSQTASHNFEKTIFNTFEQFFGLLKTISNKEELKSFRKKADPAIKEVVTADIKTFLKLYGTYGFPKDDSLFVKLLNDKNYKKLMQRMYQYYQSIFKPQAKKYEAKYQQLVDRKEKEVK